MTSVAIAGPALAGRHTLLETLLVLTTASARIEHSRNPSLRQVETQMRASPQSPSLRVTFSHLGGNLYYPWLDYCRDHVPMHDLILLVIDSQVERLPAGSECLDALRSTTDLRRRRGLLLYTKRDTPTAAPIHELNELLNPMSWPWVSGHPGDPVAGQAVLAWILAEIARHTPSS